MLTETSQQITNNRVGVSRLTGEVGKRSLDATSEVLLPDSNGDGLLLACLGEVRFKSGLEKLAHDTLANVVDFLQRIASSLERRQTDELNSFSKFIEILNSLLYLFQTVSNRVRLVYDLENLYAGD